VVACPICGDPHGYPIWIDPDPPEGCPQDHVWHEGGKVTIRNVMECKWQMDKAWQAAQFRKLVPDAFDNMGKMLPGQLGRVLNEFHKHHPKKCDVNGSLR
jgi:hypothetical protein